MESVVSSPQYHNILIRNKSKIVIRTMFGGENSTLFEIENASLILSSFNLTAVISSAKLFLIDNRELKLLKEFDFTLVNQLSFSPNNKYLVVIQKPTVTTNNLSVIDLSNYDIVSN